MKATTKTAIAVVALAAGAAAGGATAPRTGPASTKPREASGTIARPAPAEDVAQLRAELATYPELDEVDLIVCGDRSLRARLAALDDLAEKERTEAVRRISERMSETGDGLDEALALLRAEEDPRVLFWLGDVLRLKGRRIAEDLRASFAPLAVHGRPAERRRAAVSLAVGTPYEKAPPEWEEALGHVFERESDPRVIEAAARALAFVWIERPGERLLAAYDRMAPGDERRQVAVEYRRWGTFGDVVARYDGARDPAARADWVRVFGYKLRQGSPEAWKEEGEALRRIYPRTPEPKVRAFLARMWLGAPGDLEMLVPLETDRELRDLLERAAACVRTQEAERLLKEYRDR